MTTTFIKDAKKEKDEDYYRQQVPEKLANDLIPLTPLAKYDIVFDPFRGEGALYNALPNYVTKLYADVADGKDTLSVVEDKLSVLSATDGKEIEGIDWVVTKVPESLYNKNAPDTIWHVLQYFARRVSTGIAIVCNFDAYVKAIRPTQLEYLNQNGLYVYKTTLFNVGKWEGPYIYMVLKKGLNPAITYLPHQY